MLTNSSLTQKCGAGHLLQVRRQTEEAIGINPEWNDYIELRCCLGWDLKLTVVVKEKSGKIESYEVDNLIVGTCTSGDYYIRQV